MKTNWYPRLLVAISIAFALFAASRLSETRAAPDNRSPLRSGGRPASSPPSFSGDEAATEKNERRLREGTLIEDQSGCFRQDRDGATFVTDDGHQFGGRPSLNLERVIRALKGAEEPSEMRWSVSGKVTEFGNRNYLLIRRAVYKSVGRPPQPE